MLARGRRETGAGARRVMNSPWGAVWWVTHSESLFAVTVVARLCQHHDVKNRSIDAETASVNLTRRLVPLFVETVLNPLNQTASPALRLLAGSSFRGSIASGLSTRETTEDWLGVWAASRTLDTASRADVRAASASRRAAPPLT